MHKNKLEIHLTFNGSNPSSSTVSRSSYPIPKNGSPRIITEHWLPFLTIFPFFNFFLQKWSGEFSDTVFFFMGISEDSINYRVLLTLFLNWSFVCGYYWFSEWGFWAQIFPPTKTMWINLEGPRSRLPKLVSKNSFALPLRLLERIEFKISTSGIASMGDLFPTTISATEVVKGDEDKAYQQEWVFHAGSFVHRYVDTEECQSASARTLAQAHVTLFGGHRKRTLDWISREWERFRGDFVFSCWLLLSTSVLQFRETVIM